MPKDAAELLTNIEEFVHASFARARANLGHLGFGERLAIRVAEAAIIGAIDELFARLYTAPAMEPTRNLP